MKESNDILIELLTKMRIETIFKKEDKKVVIKLSDLQQFCIKLLQLEEEASDEEKDR